MNALKTSPNDNAKLKQIKVVSRVAKFLVLGFLIFAGWLVILNCEGVCVIFSNPQYIVKQSQQADFALLLSRSLVSFGSQIVLCIWYWKLSRLFRIYEQGLIFAAETIRCIKVLGGLFVASGVFTAILHALPQLPPIASPGVTVKITRVFEMGFFRFDFGTGIDFGLLLAGALIVLIAWIMDVGRKIQEEQELTV